MFNVHCSSADAPSALHRIFNKKIARSATSDDK
jgi:hypothetical protein